MASVKRKVRHNIIPKSSFELRIPYLNSGTLNVAKKNKLFHNNKIEVRKSSLQGYGVFAKEDIKNGEMLEECHYITVEEDDEVDRYLFNWPRSGDCEKYVIPLGFGSMYNAATPAGKKNTDWETDLEDNIMVFHTVKDVKKDTELLMNYNY